MSDVPPFLARLTEADQEFGRQYGQLTEQSMADGALSAKTKTLMTLALDAADGHPEAVATLAEQARDQNASEQEILETVELVAMICGTQGLATASNAFEGFEYEI